MIWTFLDTWIVIIGVLSAVACALLGNYLVLRKMSMMGDAISHTVLPGLVAAFLISGTRDVFPMFVGAVVIGVLTALLVQTISRIGNIEEGASMGVIFTSLFAVGLIMIRQTADDIDLDPSCVLYGAIEMAPLITVDFLGMELPRAAVSSGVMLLVNVLFILLFFKELKISSFDPALATTLGINSTLMHYLLMTLVAATTVAAFESVGSILVIAMLIVPAAAAHLLTDRLWLMILLSAVIAAASAITGHLAAIIVPGWFGLGDTSTAGMMATSAGLIFVGVFLAAPRYGFLSRVLSRARLSQRILREDVLAMLYRRAELDPDSGAATLAEIRRLLHENWRVGLAVKALSRKRMLARNDGGWQLSPAGEAEACNLVRSHRLWESWLVSELGLRPDHVHRTAERLEHVTDSSMQEELFKAAGSPDQDPHDRKIPGNL